MDSEAQRAFLDHVDSCSMCSQVMKGPVWDRPDFDLDILIATLCPRGAELRSVLAKLHEVSLHASLSRIRTGHVLHAGVLLVGMASLVLHVHWYEGDPAGGWLLGIDVVVMMILYHWERITWWLRLVG